MHVPAEKDEKGSMLVPCDESDQTASAEANVTPWFCDPRVRSHACIEACNKVSTTSSRTGNYVTLGSNTIVSHDQITAETSHLQRANTSRSRNSYPSKLKPKALVAYITLRDLVARSSAGPTSLTIPRR